ncbi:Uncharacterised protein [Serratia fonticola]|uniref:Uncharacterized protein n=1 Tax=Serratia fonticola TaxID=47917 RepID=A0A4U9WCY6_SERFO|nr:Uncharacterised protein [Serratia fonticola]
MPMGRPSPRRLIIRSTALTGPIIMRVNSTTKQHADQEQQQRLPAKVLATLGDRLLQLLPTGKDHGAGGLDHFGVGM